MIQTFQKFLDETCRIGSFDSVDMKHFLEPIFEREGFRDETSSNEILIVHDAGIGDFVNLSPSIRAIRQKYPNSRITMICNSKSKSLARSCPYIDSFYYIRKESNFENFVDLYKTQMEFAEKLLPFKFDLAICFCHYIDGILLGYMSGAKKIVHYNGTMICDPTIWKLNIVIDLINWKIPMNLSNMHIADRYLGLIEGMFDESIEDRSLEVWYEPRCLNIARQILIDHGFLDKSIFAIVMGGTGNQKHYPPEKYALLARKISEEIPNARFVILGGTSDIESGKIFVREFENLDRVLDLSGKINLAETSAILSMCSMYIGNDTGTMHVASAVEIPCLIPICFPADHDITPNSVLKMYYPRQVPSIIVQPRQSLPECINSHEFFFGCQSNQPHCITQIEVETMLAGFHLLLEKIQNDDRSCQLVF